MKRKQIDMSIHAEAMAHGNLAAVAAEHAATLQAQGDASFARGDTSAAAMFWKSAENWLGLAQQLLDSEPPLE